MSTQSEAAETTDGYLTLRAPTTLDDFEYLQNGDSDLAISESALRSGPRRFKTGVFIIGVAAAFTLGSGTGARTGPRIARQTLHSIQQSPDVAELCARIRTAEGAHAQTVGYPEATPGALKLARSWSAEMPLAAKARGVEWAVPSVATNAFGEIVFEWWNNKKTLAVYFGETSANFVKSPGPNLAEMSDGELVDRDHFGELFGWLQKKTLNS